MDQLHRLKPPVMVFFGWLVVMTFTVTACSSAGGQQAIPDDFTTVSSDAFSLSYPVAWEVLNQDEYEVRVAAPGPEEVGPSAAVTVDQVYDSGIDGFETAVTGTTRILNNIRQDYDEIAAESPDLRGAQTAQLIESTYTTGNGVEVHHIDLFALDEDGRLVYARAEAPRKDADPEMLRAIVSSLTLS